MNQLRNKLVSYIKLIAGLILAMCLCSLVNASTAGAGNHFKKNEEQVSQQWQNIVKKNQQRDHNRKTFSLGSIAIFSGGLLILSLACCFYLAGPLKARKSVITVLGSSPLPALWYFGISGFLAAIVTIVTIC